MPRNQELMHSLQKWECRDSTYQAATPPLVFQKAKGSRIWDAEGRSYIDLCGGFGVTALGHNNPVQKAVFEQSFHEDSAIIHGMGDVYPSVDKIELLAYLGSILPAHLSKGALALSGGQAVEIAVKTAQIATRRSGFITFEDSYHGLDLGILPLTSRKDFKENFLQWMPSHLVSEVPYACSMDVLEAAIVSQMKAGFGTAAVIVEAVQGRAGIRVAPGGWLSMLREVCDRHGVLLIFDEIFTGLGRIGSLSSSFDVQADLVCLGKALGGGLPLSVCFGRREVMDAWPQNQGEALHTGTFFGHPLSCRLGLATLKTIVEEKLCERSLSFGQQIMDDLDAELGGLSRVKSVRGQGLMIGIELDEKGLGAVLMDKLRALGVIALASGTFGEGISLTPALNMPLDDWREALPVIVQAIRNLP
ncbi:MAG: aspartate aminotransferase family protein [Proteobacteria bacterium]|nr:MAG: aspartate aminotransferase family protein [Pseudomonadota bacterium]